MRFDFIATLLAFAGAASAQTPLADDGFTPVTPQPDPDLVIVREKSYGAGGIDLTPYGIGSGADDFVQSIYFRFFVNSTNTSTTGRVVFPPGVEILGVITDGTDLGGSVDDGQFTASDLDFGIGTDPDLYSELARGFEATGEEFFCVVSPQTLVFGLATSNGVDDFRVIIDYGDSFPPDVGFDIAFYDLPTLNGVTPSRGYRIGNDANPTVPGSGDFGEVGGLLGIPLTATTGPTTGCIVPLRPESSVYMLRDTSGASQVDGFDVGLRIPVPSYLSTAVVTTPAGMTGGPDNLLYAIGRGNGYAIFDPRGSLIDEQFIADLLGENADLTGLDGVRELYFLRDTSADSFVDRFDVDTRQFVESFPISASLLATPRGIADAADGLLYAVGPTTELVSVDPATGDVTDIGLAPPAGTNTDVTGRPSTSKIYILRDTSPGTSIDEHDLTTGTTTYDFAVTANVDGPVGVALGPGDALYVTGADGSFAAFDADTGAELQSNRCMDFVGNTTDIAFAEPSATGVYCTAKTNSKGCVPAIGFSGTPSATDPASFDVFATQVINNKTGLLLYGFGPNGVPFQGGFLCIQPPVRRTPPVMSGGNPPPNDCSGVLSFDFNAFIQSGADPDLVPCTSVYSQFWYRDLQEPTGFGTGITNALQFDIQL